MELPASFYIKMTSLVLRHPFLVAWILWKIVFSAGRCGCLRVIVCGGLVTIALGSATLNGILVHIQKSIGFKAGS